MRDHFKPQYIIGRELFVLGQQALINIMMMIVHKLTPSHEPWYATQQFATLKSLTSAQSVAVEKLIARVSHTTKAAFKFCI
jgi:hypothetical protein